MTANQMIEMDSRRVPTGPVESSGTVCGVTPASGGGVIKTGAAGELTFCAHQGTQGLEGIFQDWMSLASSLPDGPQFVHIPHWYRAFLAAQCCHPDRVWFVTVHRGGELIGVIPIQYQDLRIGVFAPRLLGSIEDDQMQLSDFTLARSEVNGDVLAGFVAWLRVQRQMSWDGLRLRKVREDSAIAYSANASLPRGCRMLRHDGSSYFITSGSYDAATESMSGTFKRNLRRLSRRAQESAPLRDESVRDPALLGSAFETFLDIESSGWKGRVGTSSAIRCQPSLLAFYAALVREFGPQGICVINLLWHGSKPVAGQFCLKVGRTLNVLKVGYSEEDGTFAPGNLLLDRVIHAACEDPQTDLVSLVNEPAWARTFKPLTLGVWSYYVPNWTVRGLLTLGGLLAKRALDDVRRRRAAAKALASAKDAPKETAT